MADLLGRLGVIGSLFRFLIKRKLWWMIPFIAVLMIFGLLIVIASVTPAGPFIYALI
jgi:hypothetical protein